MSVLRAIGRLAGLIALAAVILPLQALVAGPLFHDRDTLPSLAGKGAMKLAGIRLAFNGVAPEKNGPMMYMANHQSYLDPMVLHSFLHAAMVSNDGVAKIPLLGRAVAAAGTIFVTRFAHGKYIPDAHEQLVKTLNAGRNVAVFPEGRTSDGSGVLPYKNGVLSVMFNNLAHDRLEPHVRAQAFAINVTHVNGQSVAENPSLRETFAWHNQNVLSHIWNLLKTKSMDIEVTGLPVMDPADYPGRKEFAAAAEQQMRQAHVPSPGT